MPFRNGRPGRRFIQNYMRRNPQISMCRLAQNEKPRTVAMSPGNITSSCQVFNLDEIGVSTRTIMRNREKASMNLKGSRNMLELPFYAHEDHATIITVVSADGKAWSPVAIIFRCMPKVSDSRGRVRPLSPCSQCTSLFRSETPPAWAPKFFFDGLLTSLVRNLI